jgi:CRISPR system Cascade subunit CasA
MREKQFNLIDEPWILINTGEGVVEEVSLLEVFRKAHDIKELSGELPTQDVAILRLLLAIMYSVFTKVDSVGNTAPLEDERSEYDVLAKWVQLWAGGRFPSAVIEEYLRYYEERFYLFHPQTPFYQVAGLQTAKGDFNPIAQIIMDVPSRLERRFFTNRSGLDTQSLSFSEAARWLVNLQAWDYAGKKASTVGGAPNGGGPGWLGKLGVTYAQGNTLFETLLLNFILLREGVLLPFGSPCWEQEPKTVEKTTKMPKGYVELLTWQSRRVRLFANSDQVIGALSSYGDVFEKADTFIEQMSAWHASSEKSQAGKFLPTLHRSERSVWRDLGSLLPQYTPLGDGREIQQIIPGTIRWLAYLKENGALQSSLINIRTIGSEYGAMQGVVNELVVDSVSVNANLLTELGHEWITNIIEKVDLTDKCVWQLGVLASELSEAAGNDEKSNRKGISSDARERAYYELDMPFRVWLLGIDPQVDGAEKGEVLAEWVNQMKSIVLRIGEDLIANISQKAFVGKDMNKNGPRAYSKFRYQINKLCDE